jgi:hypothetical protein
VRTNVTTITDQFAVETCDTIPTTLSAVVPAAVYSNVADAALSSRAAGSTAGRAICSFTSIAACSALCSRAAAGSWIPPRGGNIDRRVDNVYVVSGQQRNWPTARALHVVIFKRQVTVE